MKLTLFSFFFFSLLASCTKYQYLTVSGLNVPKNERNELISENDTVRVQYFFKQAEGPVVVRVYNKPSEPLEVDWRKSAIIINDRTLSYYDPNQPFRGHIATSTSLYLGTATTSGNVSGQLQSGEQLEFIPPSSYIESRPLDFSIRSAYQFADENAKKVQIEYPDHRVIYKRLAFEQDNSPVQFRSYLTFRAGKAGVQKEFSMEHRFYISEIWKSATTPGDFADSLSSRTDRFYLFR